MDDILVYGSNMKEHDERLSKVLHVLKENRLKLNDSKCHYRQSELKFLGQSISKDGVGISRDKVAAIQNLAPPTDAQKVWGNPTVVVPADTLRSYIVQSPDGSMFRCNRRHLQEIPVPVTERQFVPDVASNGSPAPHTPKVTQRPKVISEPIRGSQVIGTPKPTVPSTTTRSG